ncbi:unnamed protein product [Heligmosomoides polygyrus]|uniref:Reverse transcriptase domain-containing protein n=1 Tax=Heligmosomoides polygyrus TaxID=6339 RepID=A0A183GB61_HELPZ|nr:unnamed protein product [Heligmosomoides polygyrus]
MTKVSPYCVQRHRYQRKRGIRQGDTISPKLDLDVALQLNLTKTMFTINGQASDAPFPLNGTNIASAPANIYLGGEVNMANDLAPELSRRKRAAWGALKSVEEVVFFLR